MPLDEKFRFSWIFSIARIKLERGNEPKYLTSPALDGSLILNSLITISHSFHNRLRIAQNRFWWLFVEWCTRGIKKRLQSILAGLWCFHTVYQIVIALFLVVGRSWSLWIAGWTQRWNVVEWPCGWLAKSWDFTSFYKWAQDGAESFLVVVRQEIRAVRAGTIVARSRRIMQLNARCFFLTYTTIQKIGNWVSALCTNFTLVYCILFTICN